MLTWSRSTVSNRTSPFEVESVRAPLHSWTRGGSPGPLKHRMEVSTWRLTLAPEGTVSGMIPAASPLEKPSSEGTLGDDLIVSTALTALILVASRPPTASTMIVTLIGTPKSPFGQTTTDVPKRADRKSTRLNSSHMSISYAV